MKRHMDRVKNSKYPNCPKTCEELKANFEKPDIINRYGNNLDRTENFYIDTVILNEQYAFCLFASHSMINLVRQNIEPKRRKYLIDGTFSCAPKMFYQLLIITIEFNNDVSVVTSMLNSPFICITF